MTGRARFLVLLVLVALVGRPAREAHGENFFKRKAKAAAKAVGDVLAPGVSSLAEAASTPVIRNAESTGRRLLYDFEGVTARRLDQAGGIVNKAVDNAFEETTKLATKIDLSLEARIMQLDRSVNATIDNVGQEARATLVTVDQVIGHNIARARRAAIDVLARVDQSVQERLAQLDEIIRLRLGDVGQMIRTTLAQVDEIAKARLDQLDEIAGRRIGNLDVVATKQGLSLEAMLVRLATLLGAFAFFAFLMWSAWTNFVKHSELIDHLRSNDSGSGVERRTIKRKLGLWGLQTMFAIACFGAVVAVAGYLPRPAEARRSAQVADHARALAYSVRGYDFTGVRYHHSQLEILRPGDASFRSLALKADLLRDIFERPARMHTAEGLSGIERQLDEARHLAPGDPDFLVLTAYVIWQAGASREDELDAAHLCVQALTMKRHGMVIERFLPGRFMMRPLAENYIRRFKHDPYEYAPGSDEERKVQAIAAIAVPEQSRMQELAQVFAYNELVAELDNAMMPAYVDMLDAHARYAAAAAATYDVAAATTALADRTKAAKVVVEAWLAFDNALADSDALAGDPVSMNAFTLDDAIMSQAMYFWAEAHDENGKPITLDARKPPTVGVLTFFDGVAPPPPKVVAGKRPRPTTTQAEQEKLRLRAAARPLRTRWAERMEPLLGKHTQDVLAKEEADRFRALEKRVNDLATGWAEMRKAAEGKINLSTDAAKAKLREHSAKAALAAAEIGVWRPLDPSTATGKKIHQPFAPVILEAAAKIDASVDAKVVDAVNKAKQKRRLRFL